MEKNKRRSGETKRTKLAAKLNVSAAADTTESNGKENEEELHVSDDEEGGTRVGDIYIPPPVKPYCSTESKGPRLIITKIENENFKSYAGKVVLGPFHHCFTSIIGPNGSGKSNVIDSMLFVFGYRAQKIRCKKLSVLLHNSAKFPNTKMCTVAIHFKQICDEENGGYKIIPNSEIVIARIAFRDNSSYYTINGRRVQFKEVSKLLKQHGIDLDHNRFLILQGEVESIAMMKPKALTENECGMLEYLEDIIGTTRYKLPLEQINARVEALTEERTEKHNRCKLAEREMKDLEQPYNEAIEHLKLENDYIKAKNLNIQKLLSEQNHKLQEQEKKREEIQSELKEHDDVVNEIIKEKIEKENLLKESSVNYTRLCQTKEEMEQQYTKATNNYTETQNTMVATNTRRKQNQDSIHKLETKLEDLIKIPQKNQKEIEECEKKVEKLTKEKSKLEEELQKNYTVIENQTRPFIEEREQLETALIDKKKIEEESKSELALTESELKILQHDEISEKRKYESLKTSIEESKENFEERKNELNELKVSIPKIREEIKEKIVELNNCKKEESQLYNKVMAYKAEISEKKSNMQAAKSNNKVLDFLMKRKFEGEIPGILGRLGDLGGIDAKYDVAISTACGRLDNIVVDTVNTAQACIESLKKHDVGRASFIALEKVQHLKQYCVTKISTPENVPRLFDLVRVEDERVLPAFYFALRNTLVANDLDQGTRIAYGRTRYRVVTLRGDVIETSGTMSGGGRTQMRGKMDQKVATKTRISTSELNSSFSRKDLEQLEVKAEETQWRINQLQEQQGKIETEIQKLKEKLSKMEKDERKIEVTVRIFTEQMPHMEAQLKSQKEKMNRTHSDEQKVKQLEQEIKNKEKTFKKAEKIAKEISEKIEIINKKIADIHGNKIKCVQDKINSLTKQITGLNGNISKLKVAITTSERNVQKTEKQIEDLKEEIKNAEETLIQLKEKRSSYEQESNELQKKISEIKVEIEQEEGKTSHIRNDISALQKKENDLKLKRVEIEEKVKEIEKKISDIKKQLPSIQRTLKSLKLHEIPGETKFDGTLKIYTEEELNAYKLNDLQYECTSLEDKLNSKQVNFTAIQDYLNKREVYLERVKTLEDITNKRNEMRQLYDDVRKKRYTEFMQGFHIITRKLKEMYQMITHGGDAELELVDSMDPFTEGVTFSVRPPKKTWKNISNLSGGEKTLSSLALVFALHYYKPSPLYFMDEIDAALDFKNISIVAHYIKERTKNAQFIIISLRSNMFELSDYIVGIYKILDCTNTCTIENVAAVTIFNSTADKQNEENVPTVSLKENVNNEDGIVGKENHGNENVEEDRNNEIEEGHDNGKTTESADKEKEKEKNNDINDAMEIEAQQENTSSTVNMCSNSIVTES